MWAKEKSEARRELEVEQIEADDGGLDEAPEVGEVSAGMLDLVLELDVSLHVLVLVFVLDGDVALFRALRISRCSCVVRDRSS